MEHSYNDRPIKFFRVKLLNSTGEEAQEHIKELNHEQKKVVDAVYDTMVKAKGLINIEDSWRMSPQDRISFEEALTREAKRNSNG